MNEHIDPPQPWWRLLWGTGTVVCSVILLAVDRATEWNTDWAWLATAQPTVQSLPKWAYIGFGAAVMGIAVAIRSAGEMRKRHAQFEKLRSAWEARPAVVAARYLRKRPVQLQLERDDEKGHPEIRISGLSTARLLFEVRGLLVSRFTHADLGEAIARAYPASPRYALMAAGWLVNEMRILQLVSSSGSQKNQASFELTEKGA